jgi:cephalosporin-C deacetylase-like acetyl esterase
MRAACVLIACAALHAQSPLDVTNGLAGMVDRYLTGLATQQLQARAARIAGIHTAAEVEARQAYIHEKMLEEIGGFPGRSELEPRITGVLDRGDYKIEKLVFQSQPHYYVTANVFVPANGKAPYPAVLGTAGHSADGKAMELYQRVWVALAKRGFLVLAYDPPGQGERLEYLDLATGASRLPGGGTREHTMAGLQCILTGTNVARYFIWDGIRAFDYLLTRPDVDPKRIAVTGNSGGGTQSSYLAAFEPRLAAAAPSCYLTSWEKLWGGPGPQDAEQVFVNFLKDGLNLSDFLIAFAPKPIQMATATRDFFPIEGAKAAYAEAQGIFQVLDAGNRIGFFEFDDTHGWSKPRREATYRWLARWLQGREDDGTEPDFQVDSPEALRCTETGQVAATFAGAETVQSLNQALAGQLYATRSGVGGKNIQALVSQRLQLTTSRGTFRSSNRGAIQREGYRIEKIELEPEPGITVPALAFVPSAGPVRKPAVIYVNPAGKAADAEEKGPLEAMAREGNIVLAIDVRGWGESGPSAVGTGGYSQAYGTAMRALLVGKTMAGMQAADLLAAFDYLASRSDVSPARIGVFGKGKGGILAIFAAVLEPRIKRVTTVNTPESYMAMVRMKIYSEDDLVDVVVPGVLRDFDLPDVRKALGRRLVLR